VCVATGELTQGQLAIYLNCLNINLHIFILWTFSYWISLLLPIVGVFYIKSKSGGGALHCTALHSTTLHCTTLHCTALHCTALHCTALHCTGGGALDRPYFIPNGRRVGHWQSHCTAALHCTALHCTALHCTALHWQSHWWLLGRNNVQYIYNKTVYCVEIISQTISTVSSLTDDLPA
jgi:hypothetical protein